MHTHHPHHHHPGIDTRWSPANVALAILVTLLFLVFLLLLLIMTATPAQAQAQRVPPSAAQTVKMPEYAAKLAHAGQKFSAAAQPQHMSHRSVRHRRGSGSARGPLDPNDLYDNGPTDGEDYGWTINFGFAVADSFSVSQSNSTVNGMNFAAWLFPGDVLQSVEVSITSAPFGGNVLFDQVLTFSQNTCFSNGGFNVCIESATFPDLALNPGTYWVNLQNAVVNSGDPIYWDQNFGPSLAMQNSVGTIPSESFTILGSIGSSGGGNDYACPPPQTGLSGLRELPENEFYSGLAIDTQGHLYGSAVGGASGQGILYRLAHGVSNWFFTTLYSFLGGANGSSPGPVIVGPDGDLYGSAYGGIQNCGSDGSAYCGVIFKANPGPAQCRSTSCGWNETTLYQFTGNYDALYGTVSAFDSAGNLYGFSGAGGAYGQGAAFKLTPAQGGWSETILHSFTGGYDGATPNSLLVGHDGKLYGTAQNGGSLQYGVVFRLAQSGASWNESVLYTFANNDEPDGYSPGGLLQDSQGNLYGFSTCYSDYTTCGGGLSFKYYGMVFELTPSVLTTKWNFNVVHDNADDCGGTTNLIHALTIDSQGTLYVAQGGIDENCPPDGCYVFNCGQVFSVTGRGVLFTGNADIFTNVTSDATGHLYGTTQTCGFGSPRRTNGMVWEYSP